MNKKALSLLIVVVMLASAVPATMYWAPVSAAEPKVSSSLPQDITTFEDVPGYHPTGMLWIPPEEYARVTGLHFSPMTAKAFREAIANAPFYPGRDMAYTGSKVALGATQSLPPMIFNSLYLPPIGDQGHVGSCTAWSSTYYVWTYMINWWRNHPHPSTPEYIMNPTFTYNLINGGRPHGTYPWDAMNVISTIGAVPLNAFPLYVKGSHGDPPDYYWVWPNLSQWMMAPHNKGTEDMYWWQYYDPDNTYAPNSQWYLLYLDNDTQWNYLLHLLANGYVVQFAYPVNLVFYIATDMNASTFLKWLDHLAAKTQNQTFINYVKEHFTENETFIKEANYYFKYDRYTLTNSMVVWTFKTWWKVWSTYYMLYHHRKAPFIFGGHAVTIVGYNMNWETTDGKGVLIIANSWGSDWGDHGYFYISFDAARFGKKYGNSFRRVWVYVPKAADYHPTLMSVVGIKHPVRGEVIDGVWGSTQYIPAGIPIGIAVDNKIVWRHNFLDFWEDYRWEDITKNTTASDLKQNHPFPNSSMAFDISDSLSALTQYIKESTSAPLEATFYVAPKDLLADNITGTLYNFTLLLNIKGHYIPLGSIDQNVSIPDGKAVVVPITVPIVRYENAPNNTSLNYGTFNVSIFSLIPLKASKVVIGGKSYPLSPEEGGYYYYATAIDQKLKLPAGTYNYTVVVTYPNGKDVTLPTRTVTIKGPTISISSPTSTVYNTTTIPLEFKVVDQYANVTAVSVRINGKPENVTYNSTSGMYYALLNLTDGTHKLVVIANDSSGAYGLATVNFVVKKGAKIYKENTTNFTVAVIGTLKKDTKVSISSSNVTGAVKYKRKSYKVEVPRVNNIPAVVINTDAVKNVANGVTDIALAAGWNATLKKQVVIKKTIKEEQNRKLVAVTMKAEVKLGENGVAVVAFKNLNVAKIYVWKNGQKIRLTTNTSNPLGYYYKSNGIVFVVLKEDPVVEVYGSMWVQLPKKSTPLAMVATFNYLYYHWYQTRLSEFNELYQKALKEGVNESVLNEALKYNQTASEYYQKAEKLADDNILMHLSNIMLLPLLRQAYIQETAAVKLLKEALGE